MMGITGKVNGTRTVDGYRLVKGIFLGPDDVREIVEASPFGIDSNPVKGTIGVALDTSVADEPLMVGYVGQVRKADVGEIRIFSSDKSGVESFSAHLKNDGTCSLGGEEDNMVRYSKLEKAFNDLKADFNALVSMFNSHVHASAPNGPPTPPGSQATASAADISPAKINEIKTM